MEKKKYIFKNVFLTALLFAVSLPAKIFAQGKQTTLSFSIKNPIKANNLTNFIHDILNIFLEIGIPVITLFIIYTGFLFVSAQGNEEKLKTAKASLLWTLVGAALLLGSWVLAQAIQGTISQL